LVYVESPGSLGSPQEGQGLRHDDWAALPVEDFAGVYLNAGEVLHPVGTPMGFFEIR